MENNEDQGKTQAAIETTDSQKNPAKNKKTNIILGAVFLVLVLASFGFSFQKKQTLKNEAALKDKTEKFIKENMVQPGTDFKIADFQRDGDLYRMTIEMGSKKIPAYVRADGTEFLQVNEIKEDAVAPASVAKEPEVISEVTVKKDRPEVELFVMSYCPFGLQAEKGILPVVEKLGKKIDFKVEFVDYTLHGKPEFAENLNQYCIGKNEPAKVNNFISCFAASGNSSKCINDLKINGAKISACVDETDKQFKLTENFVASGSSPFDVHKDLNDKYGVQGSPALVINGQLINSSRDAASYLKTICAGFTSQPAECQAVLSSDVPSPGFGIEAASSSANAAPAASCGN
jgi:hypothetical protein